MKKYNRIALAILAAQATTSGYVLAEDDWVNVYGKVWLTLDKVSEDNGDDQWELNSNASRLGFKGKGAAGDLEAFYQIEWEVDFTDSSSSSDDHIKARNQFVGLRGGFGEILAGRNDTPMKNAGKRVDIFNDSPFDIKSVFNGENRASGVIQYSTPSMNGFKAQVAIVPGEETGGEDGIADGISTSFDFKTGDFQFTLAIDDGLDSPVVETTRFTASYKAEGLQVGVVFQDTDNNGVSGDGLVASASYKIDNHTLKLQLVDSDIWETGVSSRVKYESQTIVGWDYKYASNTTFTTYFGTSDEGATDDTDTVFGVGVIQKF